MCIHKNEGKRGHNSKVCEYISLVSISFPLILETDGKNMKTRCWFGVGRGVEGASLTFWMRSETRLKKNRWIRWVET